MKVYICSFCATYFYILFLMCNKMIVCRTCLSSDKDGMESIYSIKRIKGESILISEMIALCVGLEISKHDRFTNFICTSCTCSLIGAFIYRKTCWNSHLTLMDQVRSEKEQEPIKSEFINCAKEALINEEIKASIETVNTHEPALIQLEKCIDHPSIVLDKLYNKPVTVLPQLKTLSNAVEITKDDLRFLGEPNDMAISIPSQVKKLSDCVDIIKDNSGFLGERCKPVSSSPLLRMLSNSIAITKDDLLFLGEPCDKPVAAPPQVKKLGDYVEINKDDSYFLGKRYNCRICNHMFMQRDKIIEHLRLTHETTVFVPNGHRCDVCPKIFASRCSLWRHKKVVHNAISLVCDLCGATLKNELTFKQHMRKHTGEKPFKCKFCDYHSAYQFGVTSHERRAHTGEKPYECNQCGKSFVSSSTQKQHLATHSEPQFECIVCHKQFTTRTQYKMHTKIHDASKHVTCDVCEKKFPKTATLTLHKKKHTDEKKFFCKECGEGFLQRHCWRTHMDKHHNLKVL